jgi:hypothetical protein
MYIGKTRPWPANLSRRRKKKNEQKRELTMEKQQPPSYGSL